MPVILFFNWELLMDYKIKIFQQVMSLKSVLYAYSDWFHFMFRKQHGIMKVLFMFPSCHSVFDIGCAVQGYA